MTRNHDERSFMPANAARVCPNQQQPFAAVSPDDSNVDEADLAKFGGRDRLWAWFMVRSMQVLRGRVP